MNVAKDLENDYGNGEEVAWYPPTPPACDSKPDLTLKTETSENELANQTNSIEKNDNGVKLNKSNDSLACEIKNWDPKIKYTPMLWWSPAVKKENKEECRQLSISGIEIRDLGRDHFLCGEKGIFATRKFYQFDIVGEYTGRVVPSSFSGHYVAALNTQQDTQHSLGVDAQTCGNELRFVNSYLNIAFWPNLCLRTCYVNTFPHVMMVCVRDIEIGEELLLDYGQAYNDAFLSSLSVKKEVEKEGEKGLQMSKVRKALPGLDSDSSSDESDND